MPIRGSVKQFKEAPVKAIQIAVIALLVAVTALFISIGKKS